jgi:hypothetical protein
MIDPSPELPDDVPIASVELPTKVRHALIAAGLGTIGKIRETSDMEMLRIQHLVARHSGCDWLISSQSRMGRSFGATRIWMLRATPG